MTSRPVDVRELEQRVLATERLLSALIAHPLGPRPAPAPRASGGVRQRGLRDRRGRQAATQTWARIAGELKETGLLVDSLGEDPPETRFGNNAMPHIRGLDNPDYKPLIEGMIADFREDRGPVTRAGDVAEAVWQAATDAYAPLRIPAGADALEWTAEAA